MFCSNNKVNSSQYQPKNSPSNIDKENPKQCLSRNNSNIPYSVNNFNYYLLKKNIYLH